MAIEVATYQTPIVDKDGLTYAARAYGAENELGLWEGWLEFEGPGGRLVTPRETTQPNLPDLEYWASGLSPVYLEGALERTEPIPPAVNGM